MMGNEFHYAEIRVGDRVMHRFPCLDTEQADWLARRFIVDMFPEEEVMAATWNFNAGAYWATNDLGDSVMITWSTYPSRAPCGTYRIGERT